MDADLDTLVTALYVKIDDTLKTHPGLTRWRPRVGIAPKLSDAELLTIAVMQALLGFTSETRWLRHVHSHLGSAKATVMALALGIGFDAIDAGGLSAASDLEHLAMIWIRLAYSLGHGPGIALALLRR